MKDLLKLPPRTTKPRDNGITHVLDSGLSVAGVEGMIEVAGEFIDLVKLGWGTGVVTGNLEPKLARFREAGIPVMFGGTLTELAIAQDRLAELVKRLHELEVDYIEISDGTINLDHDRKLELIAALAKEFTVLSEVGAKDNTRIMAPYRWVEQIETELEAGAWKVIAEARESGNVGIFRHDGEVRMGLIDEILHGDPRGEDPVRGAAQGPAGVVRAPVGRRRQPRQHRARGGALAGDDPARDCAPTRPTPIPTSSRRSSRWTSAASCSPATARPKTTWRRCASRGSPTHR